MTTDENECRKYQQQIPAFQNDALRYTDEKRFLEHVTMCDSCKEELEIYCITEYGINDYDEALVHPDYNRFISVFDFKGLVDQRLKDRMTYIGWFRENDRMMNMITFFTDIMLLGVFLILMIIKFC